MGLFLNLYTEGAQLDRGISMLKKAGKEDAIEPFIELTKDYKSGKFLPALVKFYIKDGVSFDILKDYYSRYIKTPKLRDQKLGIEKYKNFQEFEKDVDAYASNTTGEEIKDISEKPLYEDENVKIFRGLSKNECIKYGQGSKYGFCISRSDEANLYYGYRSQGATFYFVYFKKKSLIKHPVVEELIVIHAYPGNRFNINYSKPNRDFNITKDEIIKEIPSLEKPFKENVFEHIILSEKEEKIRRIDSVVDINDLKSMEDKLIWVELNKRIVDGMVGYEKENLPLWRKYVEVGNYDLSDKQKEGLKSAGFVKLLSRYRGKLRQRLQIKLDENLSHHVTTDEAIESLKMGGLEKYLKEDYKKVDFPSYYLSIMDTDIFHVYAEKNYNNWVNVLKSGDIHDDGKI